MKDVLKIMKLKHATVIQALKEFYQPRYSSIKKLDEESDRENAKMKAKIRICTQLMYKTACII